MKLDNNMMFKIFIGIFSLQTIFTGVIAFYLFEIRYGHVKIDGYVAVEDMGYVGKMVDYLRESVDDVAEEISKK